MKFGAAWLNLRELLGLGGAERSPEYHSSFLQQILTENTDSGLGCHLDIGGHHVLDGKTSTFLLPWKKGQEKNHIFNKDSNECDAGFSTSIQVKSRPLWQGKVKHRRIYNMLEGYIDKIRQTSLLQWEICLGRLSVCSMKPHWKTTTTYVHYAIELERVVHPPEGRWFDPWLLQAAFQTGCAGVCSADRSAVKSSEWFIRWEKCFMNTLHLAFMLFIYLCWNQ